MDLILSEADRPEQRREVKTFPCLVGKAEDCDLRLQDKRLSDHHAVILLDGDRLRLIDLSSLNGTYVLQPEGGDRGKPVACPSVESAEGIPAPLLSSAPELRNGTTVAFGGLLYTCELRRAAGKPQDVTGRKLIDSCTSASRAPVTSWCSHIGRAPTIGSEHCLRSIAC